MGQLVKRFSWKLIKFDQCDENRQRISLQISPIRKKKEHEKNTVKIFSLSWSLTFVAFPEQAF